MFLLQELAAARKAGGEPAARAAAQAQRLGAGGGLALRGHPDPSFNGVYRRVGPGLHEGWPRYACEGSGRQLYCYQASERWQVSSEYRPHESACRTRANSLQIPRAFNAFYHRI